MGSLASMIEFLDDGGKQLDSVIKKLNDVQEYFNRNLNNVTKTRNSEIEFLQEKFFAAPGEFPDAVERFYKEEVKKQDKAFVENYKKLTEKREKLKSEFADQDTGRLKHIKKIRRNNIRLDNKEEKLKDDVANLEEKIAVYNKEIDELNTGFGFVSNFFRMRKIQKMKDEITGLRNELVEKIEDIREQWQEKFDKYSEEEGTLKDDWNSVQVDYSMITEKMKNLKENREILVKKAAFVETLARLKGDEKYLTKKVEWEKQSSCGKCKSDNSENKFFCNYCGERFAEDRADIMGSLIEVGELNEVYSSILAGVQETVAFLALMNGIRKAITAFRESVKKVKGSQDQYASLSKLSIDVPGFSKEFAGNINKLEGEIKIETRNLHPVEFSSAFKTYTESVFTDTNIEQFFLKMGDELDRTTTEQW
ncbi:MAG: hypothetical protein GY754_37020 [bacterium]|nr:hypothetical protein [bacterium]